MLSTTKKNVDAILCSKETDLALRVAAYQRHDNDLCFLALEVVNRRKSDSLQQLLLFDRLLRARLILKLFMGKLFSIKIAKAYLKVATKSSSELLKLAHVGCQERDVFSFVLALSD